MNPLNLLAASREMIKTEPIQALAIALAIVAITVAVVGLFQ